MFIPRLCSSIVLLSLFVCAVFVPGFGGKLCFTALAVGAAFLSIWEFAKLIENKGMKSYPVYVGIVMSILLLCLLYMNTEPLRSVAVMTLFLIFPVLSCSFWWMILCSGNKLEVLQKVLFSAASFFLFVVPFVLLAWMYAFMDYGKTSGIHKIFFYFVVATKIGDTGAYVVGSLSNKITRGHNHKLIPSISPGKSWEGLFGGLIISILFSVFMLPWAMEMKLPVWIGIVFGTVLFFGGAAGDLAESSLKRICEIKDSGKIIPGIGGVLDLVDSLLLNTPIFCFMYWLLVLYY